MARKSSQICQKITKVCSSHKVKSVVYFQLDMELHKVSYLHKHRQYLHSWRKKVLQPAKRGSSNEAKDCSSQKWWELHLLGKDYRKIFFCCGEFILFSSQRNRVSKGAKDFVKSCKLCCPENPASKGFTKDFTEKRMSEANTIKKKKEFKCSYFAFCIWLLQAWQLGLVERHQPNFSYFPTTQRKISQKANCHVWILLGKSGGRDSTRNNDMLILHIWSSLLLSPGFKRDL